MVVVCVLARVGWGWCFRCVWLGDYRLLDRKPLLASPVWCRETPCLLWVLSASSGSVSKEHQTMTRIKTIGLALIAVFAVMAVTAASAMGANSNPVLLKSNGEAVTNLSVTSSGGESFLQATAGTKAKIECKTEKSTGTATTKLEGNGMTSGSGTVTFTGCKNAAGKCSNKATGEITGTVSTLLVWVGSQANKTIGVLISILPYTGIAGSQNQLLSFK